MSTEPLAPSMARDTAAPKIGLSYEWLTRKVPCTITMCWEQVNCSVLMSLLIWRNSEIPTDGREVRGPKKYFSIITKYLVAIPAHHPNTKTIKPKIHREIIKLVQSTRIPQAQHLWHFAPDNRTLWGASLCAVGFSNIPGLCKKPVAPLLHMGSTRMSPDIVKCPLGDKTASDWVVYKIIH